MNIHLIAKLKTENEFFEVYHKGDERKLYYGRSLLFYAISNNNLDARYTITNFLLDAKADVLGLNPEHESLLHVLLGNTKHDLPKTIALCSRLIGLGVDINILDNKKRSALQWIINMVYAEEELAPLYQLWFSQACICCETKNAWGFSPLDLAQKRPDRKQLAELIKNHISAIDANYV